jgi:hypothetical protein
MIGLVLELCFFAISLMIRVTAYAIIFVVVLIATLVSALASAVRSR